MNDYLATLSSTGRETRSKMRAKIAELYNKVKTEEDFLNGQKYEKDKAIIDQAHKTIEYYNKEVSKQYDIKHTKEEECENAIREAEAIFERDLEELKRKRDAKIMKATTWRDNRLKQIDQEVTRLQGLIESKESIIENGASGKASKALHNARALLSQAKDDYNYLFMGDPQPLPGETVAVVKPVIVKPKPVKTIAKPSKQEIEEFIRNDPEEMELARMREDTRRQIERDARDRRLAEEAKREEDRKLYEAERRMQEEQEERRRQERLQAGVNSCQAQPQPPSNTKVNSRTNQEDDQEEIEEDSDMEAQIAEAKARLYQQMKIRAS